MWAMGGAGADQQDEWRRRTKPDNELPGSVALDVVLAETADVVISIGAVEVYSNGIDLVVDVRTRGDVPAATASRGFVGDEVLIGVESEDGHRATNGPIGFLPDGSAYRSVLTMSGGSGGQRSADLRLFLTPLPPGDVLTIVCAWPQRGVGEHVTRLDTAPIRAAAGRVRELWPWVPYQEAGPPEPPPVPLGGWFEETRRLAGESRDG